ncbi:MAG: 4-alpha-glucanotransferase [Actinomycetota bacterium]|nr:4-alpha-glucanotransferase [Actinomycetota bacterium]
MTHTPRLLGLVELAAACGVATEYWDQAGNQISVQEETLIAVIASLGHEVSTPELIEKSLVELQLRNWRRMLPDFVVGIQGQARRIWMHVPDGSPAQAWVVGESGERTDLAQMDFWVEPLEVDGGLMGEASFAVPGDLPIGYYTVHALSGDFQATTTLAMTPARLEPEAIAGDRQWGFMTQLYATRSTQSWGLGDLHDAGQLAAWSSHEFGAGFLLINPLHAAAPSGPMAPSPYLPVTRRFANPMYLRIADIPEVHELRRKDRKRIKQSAETLQATNRSTEFLDRDAVWTAKRDALKRIFEAGLSRQRAAQFAEYCLKEGQGLVDFALWSTLCDVYGNKPAQWPAEYADVRSPAVRIFLAKYSMDVQFHMWLQWMLNEQLQLTQAASKSSGMAIGIIHDLAVGVHPEGADAWSLRHVLAQGMGVGAPPDMYNQLGQNWHQPPWQPEALAKAAYVPYRDMLRTVMRHAGGLRIDHVLGLFRLWWVPAGMAADKGTFVTLDHEAMIGILLLEAHRAEVLVIGEDLGTVEPWVQELLRERGILGTSILWFEEWDSGAIKLPTDWRREVLASVTVHDLPPTAGFLRDEHVRIRHELKLLSQSFEAERADSGANREAWANHLREQGWLAADADLSTDAGLDAMAIALHRALAASPARLLGVALPDVIGDRRAQNQPGTDQEYPNWRVPMTDANGTPVLLEDLFSQTPTVRNFLNFLLT